MNSTATKFKKPYLVLQALAALTIVVGGLIAIVNAIMIYNEGYKIVDLAKNVRDSDGIIGSFTAGFRFGYGLNDAMYACAGQYVNYAGGMTALRVGAIVSFCLAILMKIITKKSSCSKPEITNVFGLSTVCFVLSLAIIPFSSLDNLADHAKDIIYQVGTKGFISELKSSAIFSAVALVALVILAIALVIVAIRNLKKKTTITEPNGVSTTSSNSPSIQKTAWVCASCGKENGIDADFCQSCGKKKPSQTSEEKKSSWTCPKCNSSNTTTDSYCRVCYYKKSSPYPSEKSQDSSSRTWTCPKCGASNLRYSSHCSECNEKKPSSTNKD